MSARRVPLMERLERNYVPEPNTGCWLWHGAANEWGYGHVCVRGAVGDKGRNIGAHRLMYEQTRGPIPGGMHLDHLCRTPACINPDHLEPVTPRENTMRSPIAPAALNIRKTHCPAGHPYNDVNTNTDPSGRRRCRACRRDGMRHLNARRRREAA